MACSIDEHLCRLWGWGRMVDVSQCRQNRRGEFRHEVAGWYEWSGAVVFNKPSSFSDKGERLAALSVKRGSSAGLYPS